MTTPRPPALAPSRADEDDDLEELPPLDGDGSEDPQAAADADAEDLDEPRDAASLDDATGEDDPVDADEIDLDEGIEGGWVDEAPDAPGLDLGGPDIVELGGEDVGLGDEDPEPAAAPEDDDLVLGDAPEYGGLDTGDEGPSNADEELRDEDLPALDADADEREVDDASLVDPGFGADEPTLPWAAEPWERVGAPVPVSSAIAIACAGRGAVVVGRAEDGLELLRVDLEGAYQALPAGGLDVASVVALARDGERVVAEVASGAAYASVDLGATFSETEARASAATLAALSDGEPPPREVRQPVSMATRGPHAACAGRASTVWRRLASGVWQSIGCGGDPTALAFLDDAGTLLVASYLTADDTTTLVRVDVAGRADMVARVGASRADADSDGRTRAMALDAARGVVWLAGGFGVAAFAMR